MEDIRWRFPGNNYTADNGLDTADMETFKKDAISSLAREVCQNSIDAKNNDVEGPVLLEFHSFEVDRNNIPDIDDIDKQIDACIDTWSLNAKIKKQLTVMSDQIKKDKIVCLRISDFNTTGLVGVYGGDNTPWHYLVHGSGLSDKSATSGGSKGIGKFATFVTSHFNSVFYSTRTIKNESGYEGICKLCSAKQEGTTEKTQGIGYFGSNDMNEPIQGEFVLDPDFNRSENDYGSDIFIVGFKSPDGWKRDIISKILDSFMAAIVFNSLRIDVDGIEINSETLKDVVFNDLYINKNMKKSIVSQYMLLTDTEHRYEDVITVQEYGNARLYLMEFSGEDEQYATNNCVMIRYPYMKIKELNRISSLPCSALCIIENNQLNTILRNVENPQHTNWEFNRIEDPSEKAEVQAIYKDLLDQIRDNITRHLASSDDTKTDLEGAGEYLPITENDDKKSKNEGQKKIIDKPNIRKNKVKAKNINMNASIEDPNGNGVEVDFLNANDEGEEEQVVPSGNNKGGGGSLHGDNEEHGDPDPNGHIGLRHAELRGMSYLFYCKNKKNREYGVSFSSDFDEDEAYFELYAVDDAGGKDQVNFERCFINEIPVEPINESIIKLKLQKGQRYNILMVTDQEDLFSGEVKVYAYR
ncbi:MAG: hypothetical protein IJH00_03455 [Erysipelotrichaceae bacterium]|nr:hypothetical protein [Erysipelotrichaceae bacterium]MBQ6493171.1 hypothetical protein [Erysipelotrichaceae bacterium]